MELGDWASRFDVVAGTTTRDHGFNLGLSSAEPAAQVLGRWRAFRNVFASRFPAVVLSHQVHGREVAWHESIPPGFLLMDGHDGHATADLGVLLTVTVADCIPVYLALPGRAIALLHAGWRGVAAGVLSRAVEVLKARATVDVSRIVMHCGIGICGKCYEVGSEVMEELTGSHAGRSERVDLRDLLARQGRTLGIQEITVSPWCSAHDRDRFFSHRASQGSDGRMVAFLGMPVR